MDEKEEVYTADDRLIVALDVDSFDKMKELVGIGIKDYINKIRLTEATHLLVNTDLTIMEIADKTGFSNQQYFSTVFKQAYGTSPSKYRSEQTGMNEKNES